LLPALNLPGDPNHHLVDDGGSQTLKTSIDKTLFEASPGPDPGDQASGPNENYRSLGSASQNVFYCILVENNPVIQLYFTSQKFLF
jgi:hypothetical protein